MTASTVQSSLLSNRASLTSVGTPADAAVSGGKKRVITGTMEVATTSIDEIGDVIMLCALPSDAVVTSIKLASDDLDSNGAPALAFNLGLYPKADSAVAAAKDADVYATAITLGQAATVFTDYAFEARDIAKNGQKVWQDAGDTVSPGGEYFLGLSASAAAATAAAGTLSWQVEFTVE